METTAYLTFGCSCINSQSHTKAGTNPNQIRILLLISLIIMHQSVSDLTNLPSLLWRFAACCGSYNHHGHGDADSSASRSNASGSVTAPSVFIRGAGSEHRIQKREISPLKWNMEFWFDCKGATVWVTSVNTPSPPGCFITEIAPRQHSARSWSQKQVIEEECHSYSDKVLADSLLIGGFFRRQVWFLFFFNDK